MQSNVMRVLKELSFTHVKLFKEIAIEKVSQLLLSCCLLPFKEAHPVSNQSLCTGCIAILQLQPMDQGNMEEGFSWLWLFLAFHIGAFHISGLPATGTLTLVGMWPGKCQTIVEATMDEPGLYPGHLSKALVLTAERG